MKAVRNLVCSLMICSGLVLVQGFGSATATQEFSQAKAKADDSLVEKLRDEAKGSVRIERTPATKAASFIRAGVNGDLMPSNDARPVDKAQAFIDTYGTLVGATDTDELVRTSTETDDYGTTVTYAQSYRGIPVFGGTIKAHLDEQGALTAVNGMAVPNIKVSTDPRFSTSQIAAQAVRYIRAEPPTTDAGKAADTTGIKTASTELMIYREGLVRGVTGETRLAYRVEVTNRSNIREIVFFDAQSGKLVNRYSMVDNALNRELYEADEDRNLTRVYKEGDEFPGDLNEDQQGLVQSTGEAYWFFRNSFGRDSYDGNGHIMQTVNNDPAIACPNANWNGVTTNYCDGVTSDDVVSHEWGHAYTEYTSGLIYQWQPGALNESYSDIWGETVDLINARQDEGETNQPRTVGACSTNTGALPVVDINTPASIARQCAAGAAQFGPQVDTTGVTGDVVQVVDTGGPFTGPPPAPSPSTSDGCTALTNGADIDGNIAIVDRGVCPFTVKVKFAQNAGATAVIVRNNVDGAPAGMSGEDNTITISSLLISLENGTAIVDALADDETVNVTMRDVGGVREDSFRWLIGEKSDAFGGAIRDMWSPTCAGDPGKVSDAEYKCSTDDAGGVHSNSGIPNHGYALLVDGGTYNGVTVPAIGLTKAAQIYWRAQTNYQTETTGFPEHADALEASCSDLVGEEVNGLSTEGAPENDTPDAPTDPATIEAADCAAVAAMAMAVELRTDPSQCNFQPLLAKNAPKLCSSPRTRKVVFQDDFSNGLRNWTRSEKWTYGDQPFRWRAPSKLPPSEEFPNGERVDAAFAIDPSEGQCSGAPGDYSGVMSMTSPSITMPGSALRAPRVSFRHYVSTETGYDGGNLKISVNGGGFKVVPAGAYIFNPPTTLATEAAGNTNPLEGQPGFTGTDGGVVTGSWGKSQIDLSMLDIAGGDRIRLRFDEGQDGCGGIFGWYIDGVTVSLCNAKSTTTAVQPRKPVRFGSNPVVRVRVDSELGTPGGTVVVKRANGVALGMGKVVGGVAKVTLSKDLPIGTYDLTARYRGSGQYFASVDQFRLRVIKAVTRTHVTLSPNPVEQGAPIVAKIDTRSTGFKPQGQVQLRLHGRVMAKGFMKYGQLRLVVLRDTTVGIKTFRAVYAGGQNVIGSSDVATIRVVR